MGDEDSPTLTFERHLEDISDRPTLNFDQQRADELNDDAFWRAETLRPGSQEGAPLDESETPAISAEYSVPAWLATWGTGNPGMSPYGTATAFGREAA